MADCSSSIKCGPLLGICERTFRLHSGKNIIDGIFSWKLRCTIPWPIGTVCKHQSEAFALAWVMTRPIKQTQQCRRICKAGFEPIQESTDIVEIADNSRSESDNDVFIEETEPPIDDAMIAGASKRVQGADAHLRGSYTRNSRTTAWRREMEKRTKIEKF
jgi:hypothetical protein